MSIEESFEMFEEIFTCMDKILKKYNQDPNDYMMTLVRLEANEKLKKISDALSFPDLLSVLQNELKRSLEDEEYEKASIIRDKIKRYEKGKEES